MEPTPDYPGVYVEESGRIGREIVPVATSLTAFIGPLPAGPLLMPVAVGDWTAFESSFGALTADSAVGSAIHQFFKNGGTEALVVRIADSGGDMLTRYEAGLVAIAEHDFKLLCLPPAVDADLAPEVHNLAASFCESRHALYIADCPRRWLEAADPVAEAARGIDGLLPSSPNAALYFPWIDLPDPLDPSVMRTNPPSGAIAGVFARTDVSRGVWVAPAGTEAVLTGAMPSLKVSNAEQGRLNPKTVNCLRRMGDSTVVWGARTRAGGSGGDPRWRYVPVRRLAMFIERSIDRGLDWTVFEPNDEPLWAAVRLEVTQFLNTLFRQGAFQGATASDAYFVRCDRSTMTQDDIDNGRLIIEIGIAPLKPAEFVVIRIGQLARKPGDP